MSIDFDPEFEATLNPAFKLLDLRYRQFEHHADGGIIVVGTWLMQKSMEPVLVLLHPLRPISQGKTIPCGVPLSRAWLWTQEVGDPRHTARMCKHWVESGAMPGNVYSRRDITAVWHAVQSRLTDLIAMPPIPPRAASRVMGELIAIPNDGSAAIETEIIDHV